MTKQQQDVLDRVNGLHVESKAHERMLERQGINQPTLNELMHAAQRRGPDGILESAGHLPEDQFTKLAQFCKHCGR